MGLSVIHRITGGYALLLAGLLAIAIAGISGITSINYGLQKITEKATPISELVTRINSELAAANLAMYQHYNSTQVSQLTPHEERFREFLTQYTILTQQLNDQLNNIDNSHIPLERLNELEQATPEVFAAIEKLMALYRSSFVEFEKLGAIKQNLEEKIEAIKTTQKQIQDALQINSEYAVMGEYQAMVSEGVSIAKLLAYSSDTERHKQDFGVWLKDFIELSYRTQPIKDSRTDLGALIRKNDKLITGLVWIISEKGALIELNNNFLGNKLLMSNNLGSNEAALKKIRDTFSEINDFSKQYSKDIAYDANLAVEEGKNIIFTISAITVLACIVIAIAVIQSIRSPLRLVSNILNKLATGDLSHPIENNRKDEFGALLTSASALKESLRNMILAIQNQSKVIVGSVESTESITLEAQSTINAQKEQTALVATSMNEMTLTAQEIANSADTTLRKMIEAHEEAESSQQEVDSNKDKTIALQVNMDHAVKVITQLDGDIHAIEEVIDVIESIAEQTNLLALNAAIEAARAGEQGRGFAVVADEVRTLAGRTRSSTEEIKENIATLLKASVQAVDAINTAKNTTEDTTNSASNLHTRIGLIASNIAHIKDLNLQIATAAEEQTRTSEEMNTNIIRIADLAEETSNLANQSSSKVVELHHSSNDLEALVRKFVL